MNEADVTLPTGFIRALAAATSRREVLSTAAKWMPTIIEAERSSVSLPYSSTHLEVYSLTGSTFDAQNEPLPIDGSIVGEAFSTRRIVRVDELADSTAAEAERLRGIDLRSALVCPMVIGGRVLGTINLGNSAPGFFTDEHQVLLRTIVELITSFMAAHDAAESERERARIDQLTGCLGRAAILEELDSRFECDEKPSLLFIDVDGFKTINDTLGHAYGDEVLSVLTDRVTTLLRDDDNLGRLGGDEFLIVVDSDPDGTVAASLADQIDALRHDAIPIGEVRLHSHMSIGIASPTPGTKSGRELLSDADEAMYAAKRSGGRTAVADDTIRNRVAMIASIDRGLDDGLQRAEITYHYQPIVALETNEILGAEALVRWRHPRLGDIPAETLIQRVEQTGRIDTFTEWSLRTVGADWGKVRANIPWFHDKAVSINLSPRQLAGTRSADMYLDAIAEAGLRLQDFVLEVVESAVVEDGSPAERNLRRLGDAGAIIALDDFGAGHNALRYFTRFSIAGMKFDASLVAAARQDNRAYTILDGLNSICRDLGLSSLAEGVETEATADLCRGLDIGAGQGWHFGRPMPLDEFIEYALEAGPPDREWQATIPG